MMKELTIQEWLDAGYVVSYCESYQWSAYYKLLDGRYVCAIDHLEEDFDFSNPNVWRECYQGQFQIDKCQKVVVGNEKPEHLGGCLSSFQEAFNHIMNGGEAEFVLDGTTIYIVEQEYYNENTFQNEYKKEIVEVSIEEVVGLAEWRAYKPEYFTSDSWKLLPIENNNDILEVPEKY